MAVLSVFGGPPAPSRADDSLRCQNKIVSFGASTYDVQALCGPPDFADRRTERRAVRQQLKGNCAPGARCGTGYIDTIEVTIDEWTYDFGTNRFVQFLIFESGKLVSVRSGGYGHKPPQ